MTTEKTRSRKAVIEEVKVEEPKAPVCRGHNQIHMCFNCGDNECKTKGFFKMHRCKNMFTWILSMVGTMISFIVVVAIYVMIRIYDGNWSDSSLPTILITAFVASSLIMFIIAGAIDFKHRTGDAIYE